MGSRVVTPEAVVLDIPTAGVASRSFARAADIAIQVAVAMVLSFGMSWLISAGLNPWLGSLLVIVVVLFAMPISIQILWRGKTLGKAMFGLRAISADGSPLRPRQAVVRSLLAIVEIYLTFGFVALMAAMFSDRSQRLGDMAASTVVVRDRTASELTGPIVFYAPAGYETYVDTLDVSRLEPSDFSLIRAFLLRSGSFSSQARIAEALALAEAVRLRIGHTLPGEIEPGQWLICVASAYQWRQGGMLRDVAAGVAPVRLM